MNVAERESLIMRKMLAEHGIFLDDSRTPLEHHRTIQAAAPVDRDAVHAILVASGAPEHDLEWLVWSCPSLEDARGYRPPPRVAWCPMCDEATLSDASGCVRCQAIFGAP